MRSLKITGLENALKRAWKAVIMLLIETHNTQCRVLAPGELIGRLIPQRHSQRSQGTEWHVSNGSRPYIEVCAISEYLQNAGTFNGPHTQRC